MKIVVHFILTIRWCWCGNWCFHCCSCMFVFVANTAFNVSVFRKLILRCKKCRMIVENTFWRMAFIVINISINWFSLFIDSKVHAFRVCITILQIYVLVTTLHIAIFCIFMFFFINSWIHVSWSGLNECRENILCDSKP